MACADLELVADQIIPKLSNSTHSGQTFFLGHTLVQIYLGLGAILAQKHEGKEGIIYN